MRSLAVLLRFVSRPELAARPIRSILMMGTVAVGVALMTAMHVATESIVSGFADDLVRLGGKADLQVTFGTGEAGFPEDLVTRIAAEPYVQQAAALIHSQVTFQDGERETVELFGIDILQKDVLELYEVRVLDREPNDFAILNDPRAVFLTDTLARERGLSRGSTIRLAGVDGVHDYTVRGIVATQGLAAFLGGRLVAMYLPAAQPVAGRRGDLTASLVDQVDLRLKPGIAEDAARENVVRALPPGFRADTPLQRRMIGRHTVEGLRATLVGMSTLALLASIFIIYASTTTMVLQRLPAMATLMTVGAGPSTLVRSILVEAALLGGAGAVGGVLLGLFLSGFIGADAAAGMGLNYSLPFDASRASFDPLVVFVLHPLGGMTTAVMSAWLPARRLRSVTPLGLQRDDDALLHRSTLSTRTSLLAASVPAASGAAALVHGVERGLADWVSAGGILVIVASVLALLPVLRIAWTGAGAWLASSAGVAGRIASENLLRTLDRSLVTASAIALSVAIGVGAGSLVQSFRQSIVGWYGFSGAALVSSRSVTGGWIASPVSRSIESSLRDLPGVAAVETLRIVQGQPYAGERVAVAGLSDGLMHIAVAKARLADGLDAAEALREISSGEGALVSENFQSHFSTPIGGEIRVASLDGEVGLKVLGVVADYVSDKGSILLDRQLLAARWKDSQVNFFSVRLHPDFAVANLQESVTALPDGEALAAVATGRMIERVDGLIGDAFADIDTIKLLVLFLTAVGIADLVVSNVLSRRRDLAVLRIVGLTEAQVIRMARLEGLMVTLGAALGGAAIGTLCAWIWVQFNYPVLVGYVLELRVAWASVVMSLILAVVTATVAATGAARYALRQPALATIRFE